MGVLSLCLGVYARFVEPSWIEVTHHRIRAGIQKPLRIAHVSDLHLRGWGRRENRLLEVIAQEKPEVILITGDSVTEFSDPDSLGKYLKSFHAPLGVWAVKGNWEYWSAQPDEASIYRDAGVRLLVNEGSELRSDVWIIGMDDSLAGSPDLAMATTGIPAGVLRLGLIHSPEFFDHFGDSVDIVFAGHTHGGQVRLPFLPPLWLPQGSGRYVWGWYERAASKMYVSRGIGNSILDVRFLARPELMILDLVPR